MHREMVMQHLEQAERHVSEGTRPVIRQRELVEELEHPDTKEANRLLCRFEDLLDLHIMDRDRLRRDLHYSDH